MIALVFAAAAAANSIPAHGKTPNSITAPPGLWAHADWGATRPNIQLVIENRSDVKAWLLGVACNAYDARGALVGVATADLPDLAPHARQATWAIGEPAPTAIRFTCKVAVTDWRRPD